MVLTRKVDAMTGSHILTGYAYQRHSPPTPAQHQRRQTNDDFHRAGASVSRTSILTSSKHINGSWHPALHHSINPDCYIAESVSSDEPLTNDHSPGSGSMLNAEPTGIAVTRRSRTIFFPDDDFEENNGDMDNMGRRIPREGSMGDISTSCWREVDGKLTYMNIPPQHQEQHYKTSEHPMNDHLQQYHYMQQHREHDTNQKLAHRSYQVNQISEENTTASTFWAGEDWHDRPPLQSSHISHTDSLRHSYQPQYQREVFEIENRELSSKDFVRMESPRSLNDSQESQNNVSNKKTHRVLSGRRKRLANLYANAPIKISASDGKLSPHDPENCAEIPFSSSTSSCQSDEHEQAIYANLISAVPLHALSNSIIPLQSAVRAFFARREAAIRMGALLTVQRAAQVWLRQLRTRKMLRRYTFLQNAMTKKEGVRIFCATHIQRIFRGHLVRKKRIDAALLIQQIWRSYQHLNRSRKVEKNAIFVQSFVRRSIVLRQLRRMTSAAVTFQRLWRGFVIRSDRSYFIQLKRARAIRSSSATTIASVWRRHACVENYLYRRLDIIVVQSLARRWLVTVKIRREQASIAATRRIVRTYLIRSEMKRILGLKMKALTNRRLISIQRIDLEKFNDASFAVNSVWKRILSAVITAQCHWRGCLYRRRWKRELQAAMKTQHLVLSEGNLRAEKASSIASPSRFVTYQRHHQQMKEREGSQIDQASRYFRIQKKRATKKRLEQQKLYREKSASALPIQRAMRDFLLRRNIVKAGAAICIQKNGRRFLAQEYYARAVASSILIQTCYRKFTSRLVLLEKYVGVVMIQAAWRGAIAKSRCAKKLAAIVLIQRSLRRNLAIQTFNMARQSASKISATYRCYKQRQIYQAYVTAIVVLQAFGRRCLIRRRYVSASDGVVKFQACVRGRRTYLQYMDALADVILAQSHIRCFIQIRRHRSIVAASTTISKNWRRYQNRKDFQIVVAGIIKMQAHVRRHLIQECFWIVVDAALLLQTSWRRYIERRDYLILQKLCVSLQSTHRRNIAHKQYQSMRGAATVICKNVRSYQAESAYLDLIWVTIKAQAAIRRHLHEKRYKAMVHAALLLQRNARMVQARKLYLAKVRATAVVFRLWKRYRRDKVHWAATVICKNVRSYQAESAYLDLIWVTIKAQAAIRRHLHEKRYKAMVHAALLLQRNARMVQARKLYFARVKAACILQNTWRTYDAEKDYLMLKHCAVQMQVYFRRYRDLCSFQAKRTVAITLQHCHRRRLCQHKYQEVKAAARVLSKSFRRFLAQAKLRNSIAAADSIGKWVRRYQAQTEYGRIKGITVSVQSLWRGFVEREVFLLKKESAVFIQARVRGLLTQHRFLLTLNSTILLQKTVRQKAEQRRFQQAKSAAIQIQKIARGWIQQQSYYYALGAAVMIQAYLRGFMAREIFWVSTDSCILIQSLGRKMIARERFLLMTKSAVVVQKWIRRYQAHTKFHSLKTSITTLQSLWRSLVWREIFWFTRKSAVIIQACLRGFFARRAYLVKRRSSITIQGTWRMAIARTAYLCAMKGIYAFQAAARRRIGQSRYRAMRSAAIAIGRNVRMRHAQNTYEARRASILKLQSCARRMFASELYTGTLGSTILIQRTWRRHRDELRFHSLKTSITTLQSLWRSLVWREIFWFTRKSAVIIQACLRGFFARRAYLVKRRSSITIQGTWRMAIARTAYLCAMKGIYAFQAAARRRIGQSRYRAMRSAAIAIGRNVRMRHAQNTYEARRASILKLQSCARRMFASELYTGTLGSTILIQRTWRRYRHSILCEAVEKIIATTRMFIARKRFLECRYASVTIAKTWRRYYAEEQLWGAISATMCLQRFARQYIFSREYILLCPARIRAARKTHLAHMLSLSKFQAILRMRVAKRTYDSTRQACILIQKNFRCYRTYLAKLQTRFIGPATTIATYFRRYAQQKRYREIRSRQPAFSIKARVRHINSSGLKHFDSILGRVQISTPGAPDSESQTMDQTPTKNYSNLSSVARPISLGSEAARTLSTEHIIITQPKSPQPVILKSDSTSGRLNRSTLSTRDPSSEDDAIQARSVPQQSKQGGSSPS